MSVYNLSPLELSRAQRAERADALLILVRAALIPSLSVAAAMDALGISKDDMAEARARTPGARIERPAAAAAAADRIQPRPPGRAPDRSARPSRAESGRPAQPARQFRSVPGKPATVTRPVAEDGSLRCSRCGEWKPAEEFALRTDRIGSGTRRSACTPCHAKANRSRYLSVEAFDALNVAGITLALDDDDPAARLRCSRCGKPLGATDVTTGSVSLAHTVCPGE